MYSQTVEHMLNTKQFLMAVITPTKHSVSSEMDIIYTTQYGVPMSMSFMISLYVCVKTLMNNDRMCTDH